MAARPGEGNPPQPRTVDRVRVRGHAARMSLANRLRRAPLPFDADRGREAAARFSDQPAELRELIAGAAGCSPHLGALIAQESGWLDPALSDTPEDAIDAELAALDEAAPDELGAALRRAKRRVALMVALADLGGAFTLEDVTGTLTRLADRAVQCALGMLVGEEIRRGKLPGAAPGDAATGAGLVILAMGKMGAGELNYSSDIDLIAVFDESRFDADDYLEARAAFIRVTRRLAALLSDRTAEGYVFRTDLRLRPDASVTPVCMSMEVAEQYYESMGRTWERAAHIKARPCAGDIAAGERYLEVLRPFVWRRHLDFAAIEDAHDMRLRIRAHKQLGGELVLAGHDMKLGRGGIREIEFFTQTRQLIAGGRDSELRARGTVAALEQLARKGWVPGEVTDELAAAYRAHREVEHRLQMVNDAQTHALPGTAEGFDRLARFMGEGDTEALCARLRARLERVAELTEGFFSPDTAEAEPELPEPARAIVERWQSYPALRSERAGRIFARLRPELLQRLFRAANPMEALAQFDAFLARLPAGVQLFTLFEANPQLIDLIVDICATSPRLAQYLAHNARVFDAVIGGDFFAPWPGMAALRDDLAARLDRADDYERQLDAARGWAKEWHFRVGVHHLRGLIDGFEAAQQYAELAEAVLAALWPHVVAEFARKHGDPPGRGAAVLGMGSLGAGRLNAASDLDLIVIYDADGAAESDGRRPLTAQTYYARLTKAFVTALSARMAEGQLYEVDMRLRPSGRQGPVATGLAAFRAYQSDEAWTWEHLALTRARRVAGSHGIGDAVETFRRELLPAKGAGETVHADVAQMRARLQSAKPGQGAWEAKLGPGRILDIELAAQMSALRAGSAARRIEAQIQAGRRGGWLTRAQAEALLSAYRLCWRVHCAARLITDEALDPEALGEAACAFILRETGAQTLAALRDDLAERTAAAAAVIDALLDSTEG